MVTKRGIANGDEIILFLDGVGIGTPPVRCHLIEVGAQLGGVESHQEVEKSVEAVSRLAAGKREQWQTRLVEDVALLVENGVCVRVETKRGGNGGVLWSVRNRGFFLLRHELGLKHAEDEEQGEFASDVEARDEKQSEVRDDYR